MRLNQVDAEAAIKQIAHNIQGQNRRTEKGANLFLLGAGASYSTGIPLGHEVAGRIEEELGRAWQPQPDEMKWMSLYEWAMSQLPRERQMEHVRDFIGNARLTDGRWRLNHCYLVLAEIWRNSGSGATLKTARKRGRNTRRFSHYPRVLLTTNFDPLFHYALIERYADEPKLIRHPDELTYMFPFETDVFPTTIHLHGYWQNHHVYQNLADWRAFGQAWARSLARDLSRYGLIVLGYAGCPKDIVFQTLHQIRQSNVRMSGDIYWCSREEMPPHDTYAELLKFPDVRFVRIEDADSFMLRLGVELGLEEIRRIAAFSSIIRGLPLGNIQKFENHATVALETNPGKDVVMRIATSDQYSEPGENYAGIDIYSVQKRFDLSRFEELIIKYGAEVDGSPPDEPAFEVKLQSDDASHIEKVPVKGSVARLKLNEFAREGVVLEDVDRIVLASNCERIGCGSTVTIRLKEISFA